MPPTCLKCNRPFPANQQLAVLREGSRIAFDPALGRVWRICQGCGEWNLIGVEAAQEALPELIQRFGATPGETTGAIAGRILSRQLELLQVGNRVDLVAGSMVLADRRKTLQGHGTGLAIAGLIAVVLLSAMLIGGWKPGWGFVAMQAAILSSFALGNRVVRGLRGLPIAKYSLGIAAMAVLIFGGLSWGGPDPYTLGEIALRFGMLALLTTTSIGLTHFAARVSLPSGVRIRAEDLDRLRVDWNVDDLSFVVTTGDGLLLDAEDSRHVLTHLTEWRAGFPDPVVDQAHAIVASTTDLRDFVQLLESLRTDHSPIRLADLPQVYWVAMDLALTRELETATHLEASRDVQQVADIAESLDRHES